MQGVGKEHNHKLHKGITGKPGVIVFLQLDMVGYLLTFKRPWEAVELTQLCSVR